MIEQYSVNTFLYKLCIPTSWRCPDISNIQHFLWNSWLPYSSPDHTFPLLPTSTGL